MRSVSVPEMVPALRFKFYGRSVLIDEINSVLRVRHMADDGHVRIAFDLVKIGLLDGEE